MSATTIDLKGLLCPLRDLHDRQGAEQTFQVKGCRAHV